MEGFGLFLIRFQQLTGANMQNLFAWYDTLVKTGIDPFVGMNIGTKAQAYLDLAGYFAGVSAQPTWLTVKLS